MNIFLNVKIIIIINIYFKNRKDYINIIKINKEYKDLLYLFHYNQINDYSLFSNIKIQHFY